MQVRKKDLLDANRRAGKREETEIRADGLKLTVSAWYKYDYRVNVTVIAAGNISCSINGRLLAKAVAKSDEYVTLIHDYHSLYIDDWFECPADFVEQDVTFPEPTRTAPAEAFWEDMDRVLFCASGDEDRPNLCGVLVAEGAMVATDGHRLGLAKAEYLDGWEPIWLSAGGLKQLRRASKGLSGRLEVSEHGASQRLTIGNVSVDAYGVSEARQFPEYKRVLPKKPRLTCTVDTNDFKKAVEKAALCSPKVAPVVRLQCEEDALEITSDDIVEGTSAKISIPSAGKSRKSVGLAPKYLLDMLKHCSGEVTLEIGEKDGDPCVFRNGGMYWIIMSFLSRT